MILTASPERSGLLICLSACLTPCSEESIKKQILRERKILVPPKRTRLGQMEMLNDSGEFGMKSSFQSAASAIGAIMMNTPGFICASTITKGDTAEFFIKDYFFC